MMTARLAAVRSWRSFIVSSSPEALRIRAGQPRTITQLFRSLSVTSATTISCRPQHLHDNHQHNNCQQIHWFSSSSSSSTQKKKKKKKSSKSSKSSERPKPRIKAIPKSDEGKSITFVDLSRKENNKVPIVPIWTAEFPEETFPHIHAVVPEVTIGIYADTPISICLDTPEGMIDIDPDERIMDDLYPIARKGVQGAFTKQSKEAQELNNVAKEQGLGIDLIRTPQHLTMTGDAMYDSHKEDMEDKGMNEDNSNLQQDEFSVETMFSFNHNGQVFVVAKHLEPMFMAGKFDKYQSPTRRIILTEEETRIIMPHIHDADLFKSYQNMDPLQMQEEIAALLRKDRNMRFTVPGKGE